MSKSLHLLSDVALAVEMIFVPHHHYLIRIFTFRHLVSIKLAEAICIGDRLFAARIIQDNVYAELE